MRRASARGSLAAVAVLLALAVVPAGASAHAILESTTPQRGATLAAQPKQVSLRFSESVEGNFGALRVFDAAARRVDDGRTVHPGGDSSRLAVGLTPGLPDGTYVATYRVISADSHPVSGGLVFSVGAPGAAAAPTVADLIGDVGRRTGHPGRFRARARADVPRHGARPRRPCLPARRLAARPALGGRGGGGVARPRPTASFAAARRLLLGGVLVGVVAGVAGIVLQGATAGATSAWEALRPSVVGDVARHALRRGLVAAHARVRPARRRDRAAPARRSRSRAGPRR